MESRLAIVAHQRTSLVPDVHPAARVSVRTGRVPTPPVPAAHPPPARTAPKAGAAPAAGDPRLAGLQHLTPREREVLAEVARGKNNAAVAHSLVLSERAVEKHINAVFRKLQLTDDTAVNRRVMAVLLFLSADPPPA